MGTVTVNSIVTMDYLSPARLRRTLIAVEQNMDWTQIPGDHVEFLAQQMWDAMNERDSVAAEHFGSISNLRDEIRDALDDLADMDLLRIDEEGADGAARITIDRERLEAADLDDEPPPLASTPRQIEASADDLEADDLFETLCQRWGTYDWGEDDVDYLAIAAWNELYHDNSASSDAQPSPLGHPEYPAFRRRVLELVEELPARAASN